MTECSCMSCRSNAVRCSLCSARLSSVTANYCKLFEGVRVYRVLQSQLSVIVSATTKLSVNSADLESQLSVQNRVFSHLTVEILINSPSTII